MIRLIGSSRIVATTTLWIGIGISAAGLGGCGWHPVYAPSSQASASLAAVDVALIGERQGQLLRQALQARMQGSGSAPAIYVLDTSYSVTQEGIGIEQDSSVTRVRMIAAATFVLRSLLGGGKTCYSATARAVDGYDMQNEQFFASDLEAETVNRRLANAIADQVVTKLALTLDSDAGKRCEVR